MRASSEQPPQSRTEGSAEWSVLVDVSTVPHAKHGRKDLMVVDLVDGPMVAGANSPFVGASYELRCWRRTWVVGEDAECQTGQGTMVDMKLVTPTLRTDRLQLRPFASGDASALFALHSSARVLRYWDAPPWDDRERAHRFLEACARLAEEGSGARVAVERVADGVFIGWCSLTRWNPEHRSASMGYCYDESAWGHGYATEAARGLLAWAFRSLDLNRVQAETDTRNLASARVLEKVGFVREGTLREDCVVNGETSDSWVYGLLRRDWEQGSEPATGR